MEFDSLSNRIIKAALTVHSSLGPGLFEEVYKACLRHELSEAGLYVLSEVMVPVTYAGIKLEFGYRLDLLVEDTTIVEVKSVEQLAAVHKAQLLTYLRFAQKNVGLLLNFNTHYLRHGISRIVNSFPQ